MSPRLQRPSLYEVRWLGQRWAIELRVAPRSRVRVLGAPPANRNAWPADVRMPSLAVLLAGAPRDADPYLYMCGLHARGVEAAQSGRRPSATRRPRPSPSSS